MNEEQHQYSKGDGSWWMNDSKGIPLCRVCGACEEEHRKRYNPIIFSGYTQADFDEQIEPDDWA